MFQWGHAAAVLVLAWPLAGLLGYLLHRGIHHPRAGRLYKAHIAHHKAYPVSDFTSDTYREVGKDSTVWTFLGAGLILGLFSLVLFPVWFAVPFAIDLAIMGYISDKIHGAMHLNKTHWDKFILFEWLQAAHVQHHKNVKTNYGIFSFFWDYVFRTYRSPDHND